MSEFDAHPPVPPGVERPLLAVVQATREAVEGAAAGAEFPSPAYALCLWVGDDDEDLSPMSVSFGLEDDRRRHLAAGLPDLVWSHADYALDELDVRDNDRLPGFTEAAAELVPRLLEAGIVVPSLWVLEEAARALTREPPRVPVTEDFVAFAVASFTTAESSVEHSLTPSLRARLVDRGLLRPIHSQEEEVT